MRRLLPVLALFSIAIPAVSVTPATARPVVIELFTSQGCSSCPPADAHLTELARQRSDILPLAFHVTYWNRLGWTDPYSLTAATERQEAYAGRLGETSFTPQLVVDGRASVIGSRRGEVAAAIAKARAVQGDDVPVNLTRGGDGLTVTIGAGKAGASARILLVGFDRERVTPVRRGENGGRTLTESNVVRAIRLIGAWRSEALSTRTSVPAGEDAAVILQGADGRILGAARL